MKNSINQIIKVLIVLFITSLTISCTDKKKEDDQNHREMMNEDQTEIMEGDDHLHENDQTDKHMVDDTATMEMNEESYQ